MNGEWSKIPDLIYADIAAIEEAGVFEKYKNIYSYVGWKKDLYDDLKTYYHAAFRQVMLLLFPCGNLKQSTLPKRGREMIGLEISKIGKEDICNVQYRSNRRLDEDDRLNLKPRFRKNVADLLVAVVRMLRFEYIQNGFLKRNKDMRTKPARRGRPRKYNKRRLVPEASDVPTVKEVLGKPVRIFSLENLLASQKEDMKEEAHTSVIDENVQDPAPRLRKFLVPHKEEIENGDE